MPPGLWQPWYDTQGILTDAVNGVSATLGLGDLASLAPEYEHEFVQLSVFFAVLSGILAASWIVAVRALDAVWPAFRAIEPGHKKMYVVANLCKSLVLGLQAASASWWYYSYLHYRCTPDVLTGPLGIPSLGPCEFASVPMQEYWTKIVTATYVSTDFVALLMVTKLPLGTKIHHWTAFAIMLAVWRVSLNEYEVGQKLMM